MLKKYRIIRLVFILFLLGLPLLPVSTVFAEDSAEFIACQQIKPHGDFNLMKQKKNCFYTHYCKHYVTQCGTRDRGRITLMRILPDIILWNITKLFKARSA